MAGDGDEAVRQAELLNPDVAVLDVRMPKMNGIQVAQKLKELRPDIGVVIISHYDDTEYIVELLKDGPEGKAYLLKTSVDNIDELIRAVEGVAQGQTVLDPIIVQRLAKIQTLQAGSPIAQLTEREKEVLALMAEGYTNAAIAKKLFVEERTVENPHQLDLREVGLDLLRLSPPRPGGPRLRHEQQPIPGSSSLFRLRGLTECR